jgi:hypothetical protein
VPGVGLGKRCKWLIDKIPESPKKRAENPRVGGSIPPLATMKSTTQSFDCTMVLSQTQLAKAMRSTQSRVAKMEAGDPTVSLDLLVQSLLALGASNRDLGQIIGRG